MVCRDACQRHLSDVAAGFEQEVPFIEFLKAGVDLGCKNATVAQSFEGHMESPQPGEQIDEFH